MFFRSFFTLSFQKPARCTSCCCCCLWCARPNNQWVSCFSSWSDQPTSCFSSSSCSRRSPSPAARGHDAGSLPRLRCPAVSSKRTAHYHCLVGWQVIGFLQNLSCNSHLVIDITIMGMELHLIFAITQNLIPLKLINWKFCKNKLSR